MPDLFAGSVKRQLLELHVHDPEIAAYGVGHGADRPGLDPHASFRGPFPDPVRKLTGRGRWKRQGFRQRTQLPKQRVRLTKPAIGKDEVGGIRQGRQAVRQSLPPAGRSGSAGLKQRQKALDDHQAFVRQEGDRGAGGEQLLRAQGRSPHRGHVEVAHLGGPDLRLQRREGLIDGKFVAPVKQVDQEAVLVRLRRPSFRYNRPSR